MKRKLLTLIFIATTTLPAMAIDYLVGFMGGYDYNDYNISTNYAYDLRYKGQGGLTMGIPVLINLTDWFKMRSELQYIQKNHQMHRTHLYAGSYTNTQNHYLQLPISLQFSFGGEKVRGYLNAGGFVACWLASHRDGATYAITNGTSTSNAIFNDQTTYKFDEYYKIDNAHDRRVDAGVTGGVGVMVVIDKRMTLFLETGCYYGFLSSERDKEMVSPSPRYNTTYTLQLGLLFSVAKKHK